MTFINLFDRLFFPSRSQESVDQSLCVWSQLQEELESSVPPFQKNCWQWLESKIVTHLPVVPLVLWAISVSEKDKILSFILKFCQKFVFIICSVVTAKATYAAIAKTYAYLTPDLWKDVPLKKTPYSEFADHLSKCHKVVQNIRADV